MKNRILIPGLAYIMIIWLYGCQYDPYAHRYTTQKPLIQDVTGTYVFHKQTVDRKASDFRDSISGNTVIPELTLYDDGTYQAKNLPEFDPDGAPLYSLVTREGTWKLEVIGSIGEYNSDKIRQHWGIQLHNMPASLFSAGLMNSKPPHSLIWGYGDPDAGAVMIFHRKQP